MKLIIVSVSIVFVQLIANAQTLTKKEINKKNKTAEKYFDIGDYKSAMNIYQVLYNLDTLNPDLNYKMGVCMFSLGKFKIESISYFLRAAKGMNIEVHYYLAQLNHLNLKFEDAKKHYGIYRDYKGEKNFTNEEIARLINISDNAIYYMQRPSKMNIENAGNIINSQYPDYVPLISADESIMIFTSRREGSTGNLVDPNGDYFEDVYISKKTDDKWSDPRKLSVNINTPTHDACVALSASGEQLYLYRTSPNLIEGDLYVSNFDGSDWTLPEKLGSDINTPEGVEPSASITADNNTLYFSSSRDGSLGGKDIYKAVKLPDGNWSKATSLPSINTLYEEDAPFIHPDGKTLYFSSKGHKTMGGYDIFKSTLNEDGSWTVPENLGYPLNSVDDDIYFVLSVNGSTGYYSSKKNAGIGETDIYIVKIPDDTYNLTITKGEIRDEDKNPILAKITLVEVDGQGIEGIYKTNKLTGKFVLILSPLKKYKVFVEAAGYHTYSSTLENTEYLNIQLKKNNSN